MAVDTITVGVDTQIIDLKTGKFTKQGWLIFQSIAGVVSQSNTTASDLTTHAALTATASTAAHVKRGTNVADAAASSVSIAASNISTAPGAYTQAWGQEVEALGNELKSDVNTLVTDVNAIKDVVNSILSSLETAGTMASS